MGSWQRFAVNRRAPFVAPVRDAARLEDRHRVFLHGDPELKRRRIRVQRVAVGRRVGIESRRLRLAGRAGQQPRRPVECQARRQVRRDGVGQNPIPAGGGGQGFAVDGQVLVVYLACDTVRFEDRHRVFVHGDFKDKRRRVGIRRVAVCRPVGIEDRRLRLAGRAGQFPRCRVERQARRQVRCDGVGQNAVAACGGGQGLSVDRQVLVVYLARDAILLECRHTVSLTAAAAARNAQDQNDDKKQGRGRAAAPVASAEHVAAPLSSHVRR